MKTPTVYHIGYLLRTHPPVRGCKAIYYGFLDLHSSNIVIFASNSSHGGGKSGPPCEQNTSVSHILNIDSHGSPPKLPPCESFYVQANCHPRRDRGSHQATVQKLFQFDQHNSIRSVSKGLVWLSLVILQHMDAFDCIWRN